MEIQPIQQITGMVCVIAGASLFAFKDRWKSAEIGPGILLSGVALFSNSWAVMLCAVILLGYTFADSKFLLMLAAIIRKTPEYIQSLSEADRKAKAEAEVKEIQSVTGVTQIEQGASNVPAVTDGRVAFPDPRFLMQVESATLDIMGREQLPNLLKNIRLVSKFGEVELDGLASAPAGETVVEVKYCHSAAGAGRIVESGLRKCKNTLRDFSDRMRDAVLVVTIKNDDLIPVVSNAFSLQNPQRTSLHIYTLEQLGIDPTLG